MASKIDSTPQKIDFAALAAPFPVEAVSFRVGSTNKDKTDGMAFAYIDARDVRKRLNEVCGPENWKCHHYDCGAGKLACAISIKIDGEWVEKTDGSGDTDFEAEKGAFSGALKRAAFAWGVGEYLYDFPTTWVKIDDRRKTN
jgi:hypothetical protein